MSLPEISVTKTYSLTMSHIVKVAEMAEYLEVSQGEVLRQAIDLLYDLPSVRLARETHPNPVDEMVAELRADLPEIE